MGREVTWGCRVVIELIEIRYRCLVMVRSIGETVSPCKIAGYEYQVN